jgi:hypothetical protein
MHIADLNRYKSASYVLILALAITLSHLAHAQSDPPRRFPQSHITAQQWEEFFKEIKAKPDAQDVSRPQTPDITVIAVPSESTMYFFTRPGPAHPAVVVERVTQKDGHVYMNHTGYFAGSEEAFAKWFNAFQARSDSVRSSMKSPQ